MGDLETDLKRNAERKVHAAKTPLESVRYQCLTNGSKGIKQLGRTFRIWDDSGNKKIELDEFMKGLQDYGVKLEVDKIKQLFDEYDRDGSGHINIDEFLMAVRPPMSHRRKKLIMEAFLKLDRTDDGVITVADLKGVYNVKKHPKYQNGECTEDQILRIFLDNFDGKNKDGTVTKEEFLEYYAGISVSIDDDAYFDLMMRNSWNI